MSSGEILGYMPIGGYVMARDGVKSIR